MHTITFATGNSLKFFSAQQTCAELGIVLTQDASLDIVEIQAETGEPIARHKANEAFKLLQKPLVVTDDTWQVPALNGFPGPYMKSMNHWLNADDWLRLMHGVEDRRVFLRQIAVYQDAEQQKLFAVAIPGVILHEARGQSLNAAERVVSLDDGKHSIAELANAGKSSIKNKPNAWHGLAEWLTSGAEKSRLAPDAHKRNADNK